MFLFPSPREDTPSEWPSVPLTSTHLHHKKSLAKQKIYTTNNNNKSTQITQKSRHPRYQARQGWAGRSTQTCTSWNSLEVCSSTFPQYSHLTWLLAHLSLSGGWRNYLLHQSRGQANARHRGLHFTQPSPAVAKETEPITGGVSLTLAIHHFVLLKVFQVSCTAAWSCLRTASAILLHRWKCLGFENTDLREQLPLSCLLACRLSWQSAKAEVRGVGLFFTAKMATSGTSTSPLKSTAAPGDLAANMELPPILKTSK